jgi:DNA-binding LacI/PurR family transcriptional regulator
LPTTEHERQEIGRTAVRQIVRMIQASPEFIDGRETVRIQPHPLVRESSVPSRFGKEVHQPAE